MLDGGKDSTKLEAMKIIIGVRHMYTSLLTIIRCVFIVLQFIIVILCRWWLRVVTAPTYSQL